MMKYISLFILMLINFSVHSQVRKIGTVNDSITFTSIIIANDSSVFFIGNKGVNNIIVLKANTDLDTLWTKIIETPNGVTFPIASYSSLYGEIIISCHDTTLIKLREDGTLISYSTISIQGSTFTRLGGNYYKGDSILTSINYYDNTGYHYGLAITDTAFNLGEFRDFGDNYVGEISKFNNGYFISGSNIVLDSNYNFISKGGSTGPGQFYSFWAGRAEVLNDSIIVGSTVVYNNFGPEADEIFKMTKDGLQWVVKDDFNIAGASFYISPVRINSNGDILFLATGDSDFYIGVIDSTGFPLYSNRLNVSPDNWVDRIATKNRVNDVLFAFGNVFGRADSTGKTCFSSVASLDQCSKISGYVISDTIQDSTSSFLWNLNSNTYLLSQNSFLYDVICTPLAIVENFYNDQFEIYPNPFSQSVQISSNAEGELIVIDQLGRIVHQSKIACGLNEPELNKLSSGIYNFRFLSKGIEIVRKVIKIEQSF
ncbi:MAG: T9SS type A sorting domain-containing protein [Bacteroidia bacterium]|nr:T9SS type A sorting domain-containing protein [Bacteroidia bacterium]